MTEYALAETESSLNQTADDRSRWRMYTADPVMVRKMESVGATLLREYDDGVGRLYELNANQVSFRKGLKHEPTEAQRQQVQRLGLLRAKAS